jgi:hypothetical protein
MSDFKEEAEKRDMKKLLHEPLYLYMKKTDGSWIVKKFTGDKENDKEYEITALGSCSCDGYKYNNKCKHSEVVMEQEFWPHATSKERAKKTVEKVKKTYSFDMELKGYKENDDNKPYEAVFSLKNNKLSENYDEIICKSNESDLLIRFEMETES